MLYNVKSLFESKIQAIDGEIGKVDDLYFDDNSWGIRYMVVDTAKWIEGKKVLLSPVVVEKPDVANKKIIVKLTKEQIRNSPDIETRKPVSKQFETEFPDYYQWPVYGMSVLTTPIISDDQKTRENSVKYPEDPHLRSAEEVIGYNIGTLDGEVGHVEDMILDDETWSVHFWIVKTRNWLPGKRVLISPHWINKISWIDKKVFVDMTTETIKNSPEFDSSKPLQIEYESELNNYYGRTRMNS